MRARIFICALGLVLLAALFTPSAGSAQISSNGDQGDTPCGFPLPGSPGDYVKGTSAAGGKDFHDPPPTTGWDWWEPDPQPASMHPVPVFSMISGITRIGTDRFGNTYIYVSNSGWTVLFMHLDSFTVGNGEQVRQGQQVGIMGDTGNSAWTHLHLSIKDNRTGEFIKDHEQFFDCGARGLLGSVDSSPPGGTESGGGRSTEPDESGSGSVDSGEDAGSGQNSPTETSWLSLLEQAIAKLMGNREFSLFTDLVDRLKKLIGQIKSQPVVDVPTPPPPQDGSGNTQSTREPEKVYGFSISAQKPDSAGYQHNVRAFFAWPSLGRDLSQMTAENLENFEGSWLLPPGSESSVNTFFGDKIYEEGQGMVTPPGWKIGDGSCNAASFLTHALIESDLQVDRDDKIHAPVPGVPQEHVAKVCIPSNRYKCSTKDVRVTNPYPYPVRLHWRVEGDTLSLWVEKVGAVEAPSEGSVPSINWTWVAVLLGALIVGTLVVLKILSRRPETVDPMVLLMDHAGYLKALLREAVKFAVSWDIFIITLTVVISPTLREMVRVGFLGWIEGHTSIPNRGIVALILALLVNVLVRAWRAAKKPQEGVRMLPDGSFVQINQPETNRWWWLWLLLGVLYAIAPDLVPGPADDILALLISIYKALPPATRRRFRWIGVLLVAAAIVFGYMLISGAGGSQPPAPEPVLGSGANPYLEDFLRAGRLVNAPNSWAQDESLLSLVEAESKWDTEAKNPNSTAFGLFQMLSTTWETYLPEMPYGTKDPYWQAVGGYRYIRARYSTPACAWSFWQATTKQDSGLACPEHQDSAKLWISRGWAGY